jgi:hypothetical protein
MGLISTHHVEKRRRFLINLNPKTTTPFKFFTLIIEYNTLIQIKQQASLYSHYFS